STSIPTNLHIHPGEPCTQLVSLPHSAVEAELHATTKASAMLHSDIRRWRLGLCFPLDPLEFLNSVHQRLINTVVRRVRWFRFFPNSPSTSAACADHIANSLLLLDCLF